MLLVCESVFSVLQQELFFKYTLDSICEIAFGIRLDSGALVGWLVGWLAAVFPLTTVV